LKYTWRKLNELLVHMTEEEVKEMLDLEMQSHRRGAVIERLHQRYNTLRVARERVALLKEAVK